jgi:hypothetical protein
LVGRLKCQTGNVHQDYLDSNSDGNQKQRSTQGHDDGFRPALRPGQTESSPPIALGSEDSGREDDRQQISERYDQARSEARIGSQGFSYQPDSDKRYENGQYAN